MAREKKTSTSAPEMKKERKVLEFNTVEQGEAGTCRAAGG